MHFVAHLITFTNSPFHSKNIYIYVDVCTRILDYRDES